MARRRPLSPAPEPATAPAPAPAPAQAASGRHRSGAVARMLRMPVATLRVWERRYALSQPQLSPSGQRLYSADDVRRLAQIKQLCDSGHAIGSLAGLSMAQLQVVASTHASALAPPGAAPRGGAPGAPLGLGIGTGRSTDLGVQAATGLGAAPRRVVVLGAASLQRLQQPAVLQRLPGHWQWLGPFADGAQAWQALAGQPVDALLYLAPRLHAGWLADARAAAPGWAALPQAVLYQFAADATCQALADAGIQVLRGPQSDAALAQWLVGWLAATPGQLADGGWGGHGEPGSPAHGRTGAPSPAAPPPRRWDDAALAEVVGLSSTIACECPRHVAELLQQLAHFEAYSAECAHRSPADAALHTHLQHEAAHARARLETALEQVARHEGLILPG